VAVMDLGKLYPRAGECPSHSYEVLQIFGMEIRFWAEGGHSRPAEGSVCPVCV